MSDIKINNNSEDGGETLKSERLGNGSYALLLAIISSMFSSYSKSIAPHSLSIPKAIFLTSISTAIDFGVLYFTIFWISDRIRCRGKIDRPENRRFRFWANIIFIIMFLFVIFSLLKVKQ